MSPAKGHGIQEVSGSVSRVGWEMRLPFWTTGITIMHMKHKIPEVTA